MEDSNTLNDEKALAQFVQTLEPLSNGKTDFILNYKGETFYIDFKVSFNTNEQREWLKIAKDIYAFANTYGGYIVFGIRDKTFEKIGIEDKDWKIIIDPDNIQKRINSYVLPPITSVTTAHNIIADKNFIIVHIPPSLGETHIVVKEGKYQNKKGEEVIELRKGEIYVRRSGSSVLIEPNDLNDIIKRRIDYYKKTLLQNIAKVVEAPPNREVLIFDPNTDEIVAEGKKFKISSDKDAIPVAGLSPTVIPQTDENEIVTIIAAFRKDRSHLPGINLLYRIYAKRNQIQLSKEYFSDIAKISIYRGVPCFYWLQFLTEKEIKNILDEVFEKGDFDCKRYALRIAACIGDSHFKRYLKKGDNEKRYESSKRKYSQYGCNGLFSEYSHNNCLPDQIEMQATELANELYEEAVSKVRIDPCKNDQLWSVDYKLYAPNITKKVYE